MSEINSERESEKESERERERKREKEKEKKSHLIMLNSFFSHFQLSSVNNN